MKPCTGASTEDFMEASSAPTTASMEVMEASKEAVEASMEAFMSLHAKNQVVQETGERSSEGLAWVGN